MANFTPRMDETIEYKEISQNWITAAKLGLLYKLM